MLLLRERAPYKVEMDFVFVSFTILYLLFSGSAKLDKMLAPLARSTTCGKEEDNAIFGSGKHIFFYDSRMKKRWNEA